MSDCCPNDAAKAPTVQNPSDCFDECRLSLTKADFKTIDTNNSGALSAFEIDDARQSPAFFSKQGSLDCLLQHLENTKIDANINGTNVKMGSTLLSWHGTEFAQQQLSKDDFQIIDANGNNVLELAELRGAKESSLSDMDKQAAKVLAEHLDATMNDPLLSVKDGIKSWHDGKQDVAAPQAASKNDGVPGINYSGEETIAVKALDANSRPTEVEASQGLFKLSYDDKGRVTNISNENAYGETLDKKISYDDEKNTQTIKTSYSGQPELDSTTVNHLDKSGNVVREDFSSGSENIQTIFDKDGRIASQVRTYDDRSRIESQVVYGADGSQQFNTMQTYDANGVKASEFSYDEQNDKSVRKLFDANGNVKSYVERTGIDNAVAKEINFDADGNKIGTTEMSMVNYPHLMDRMIQKDAEGNVTAEISGNWKPIGRFHALDSIDVKTPDGETKTLTDRSKGDDLQLFHELHRKFFQNNKAGHNRMDERSPGSFQTNYLGGPAAC